MRQRRVGVRHRHVAAAAAWLRQRAIDEVAEAYLTFAHRIQRPALALNLTTIKDYNQPSRAAEHRTAVGADVNRPTTRKKDWVLDGDAFDRLLARLDPDPEQAADLYEGIRRRLISFFEYRGGASPEDLADETINRVARRLSEGTDIHASNPADYFFGVARRVISEHWDSPQAGSARLDDVPPTQLAQPPPTPEAIAERDQRERGLDCLDRCLHALAAGERDLIIAYYQGETSVKIQNRKRLAARLGIAANALRIRALRIREKLEACVEGCLHSHETP
jgi:RNA polymerase sigma factor (sigma-70 family)